MLQKKKTPSTQRKRKKNSHGLTPCTVVPPYPDTVILPYPGTVILPYGASGDKQGRPSGIEVLA